MIMTRGCYITLTTSTPLTSNFNGKTSKRNECELNKTLQLIKKNEIVEDDDKQLKLFLHMIKECLEHARNMFTYAEFCRIHVLCFGVQPFNHPQLPRNCCT